MHELCYAGPAQAVPSCNVGAVVNVASVQEALKLFGEEEEFDHMGAF